MFFGLDMEKLLLIGVLAALLIGPERLPKAAETLGRLARQARDWTRGAKGRMKEEMGDDFDDIEWRKLDPRQYDPRRIIRDALLDDPAPRVQAPPVAPIAPHVPTDALSAPSRVIGDPLGAPDPANGSAPRTSFGAPKPLPLDDEQGFPPLPEAVRPAAVAPTAAVPPEAVLPGAAASDASAPSDVDAAAAAAQTPPVTASVLSESSGQA